MKTTVVVVALVFVLVVVLSLMSRTPVSKDSGLISQNGIHWHPTLHIYIKGEKFEIPANIGVGPQYTAMPSYGNGGMSMTSMHTHDDMPVVHLEFSGVVKEDDIRLGNFFRIWGKDMQSMGSNMRMMVNGTESIEYENLLMRDGDKIELLYD